MDIKIKSLLYVRDRIDKVVFGLPGEIAVDRVVDPAGSPTLPAELFAHQLGEPCERSFAVFERGTETLQGILSQRKSPEGWGLVYVDKAKVLASSGRLLSRMKSLLLGLDRPEIRRDHARLMPSGHADA